MSEENKNEKSTEDTGAGDKSEDMGNAKPGNEGGEGSDKKEDQKNAAESFLDKVKAERIALEKVRDSAKAENDRAEKIITEAHLDGKGFAGLSEKKEKADPKDYGKSIMAGKIPTKENG